MNTIRKLSIDIQDFEKLRTNNYLYVNKTQYVYLLTQTSSPYFLGRPRRFGKSLFLSTLKAYFEGKRELFEGLKIVELEKEWTKYPVIYLDFNVGLQTNVKNVSERLSVKIKELERLWGQKMDTEDLASRFEAVIKSAYEQTGKPVVVLTPITTGNFSVIEFMQQIKSADIDGFMTALKAFFADIPYDAIEQKHRDEQYYQHVFYLLFTLMGQFVQTEVKNNKGRADAVVKTADSICVFEFKMDDNATAEDALKQINSKDYSIPYTADHRKLVKIGVEFSQIERGVKRWLIE